MNATLNTAHAREMLYKRYPTGEWAVMEEVAPRTGGGTRYADAVAVNLWQSRGHAVHGFEIKVSRSDWLRELKQPAKAEDVYRFCDFWWIVAPAGVVVDGELPATWGLLELRESGLVQKVAAPKLDAAALTRAFFASLIRRGQEGIVERARRMQDSTVQKAREEIDQRVRVDVDRSTQRHKELGAKVAEFEEKTGLVFGRGFERYPPLHTIRLAMQLQELSGIYGSDRVFGRLRDLAAELDRSAKELNKALDDVGLVEPVTEASDA